MERADTAEPPSTLLRSAAPVLDEFPPVLDPTPLEDLSDDAGDAAAQRFFAEYLDFRELPDAAAVLAWMSMASRLILHKAGTSLGPLSATPRLLGSASIVVDQQSPGLASSDRNGEACPGPVFRLRQPGSEDEDMTRVGAD